MHFFQVDYSERVCVCGEGEARIGVYTGIL